MGSEKKGGWHTPAPWGPHVNRVRVYTANPRANTKHKQTTSKHQSVTDTVTDTAIQQQSSCSRGREAKQSRAEQSRAEQGLSRFTCVLSPYDAVLRCSRSSFA